MNKEEIFDVITKNVREVIPKLAEHRFKADDSLRELGANSVDRSEIIMMTLEDLEVSMPLMELARAENISDMASIVYAKS